MADYPGTGAGTSATAAATVSDEDLNEDRFVRETIMDFVLDIIKYETESDKKYNILSKFLGDISRRTPSLDGVPLENHIWATGAAKEI